MQPSRIPKKEAKHLADKKALHMQGIKPKSQMSSSKLYPKLRNSGRGR